MKVYRNVTVSGDSLLVVNKETLTGSKVLTVADIVIQWLDPGGASRDVTFPAEADSLNLMFWIYNNADGSGENLVVKNDGATTLGTLGPGMLGIFSCDGTDWKWENDIGLYYDAILKSTTITKSLCFDPQILVGDGTTTINWNNGNKVHFTWGAQAEVFTFTAPSTAASLLLKMTQDGVGGRDATWPAAVTWLGTEPTWTDGGAGKTIVVAFYYDGTTYWGQGTEWET